ncbi:hypothetical protein VNI00_017584 [Paramarasmius palmivorus]|uniref:Uncharacterized protein n=1 Tax=Paramarasmius palmivorus TaxID=297713 RepID=A0AAW0B704_9AGAR
MPPIFLKNRRSSTPPNPPSRPHDNIGHSLCSLAQPNMSHLFSIIPGSDQHRSPSPAISEASSTDSESAVSALWKIIHKDRIIVAAPDGWRFEYRSNTNNLEDTPSSDCLDADRQPYHTTSPPDDRVNSDVDFSEGKLEDVAAKHVHEPPANSKVSGATQCDAFIDSSGGLKRSDSPQVVTGQYHAEPELLPPQRRSQKPQKATRVDLGANSSDKRRKEQKCKAKLRGRKKEEMRAKQAVYATTYRAKNREKLKEKAWLYQRNRKARLEVQTQQSG